MVIDPSNAVIAAPASASFTGVAPLAPERAERVHDDRRDGRAGEGEPDVAEQRGDAERVDRRSTTNSAAPALTPRMPGSASGLRVTPCITAPANPSATPTSSPTIVRGTRSDRTIRWSFNVES